MINSRFWEMLPVNISFGLSLCYNTRLSILHIELQKTTIDYNRLPSDLQSGRRFHRTNHLTNKMSQRYEWQRRRYTKSQLSEHLFLKLDVSYLQPGTHIITVLFLRKQIKANFIESNHAMFILGKVGWYYGPFTTVVRPQRLVFTIYIYKKMRYLANNFMWMR